MDFIDLGSTGHAFDAAIMLPTPMGQFVMPMMLDVLVKGKAPIVTIVEMWQRLWPESYPGDFAVAVVCAQLDAVHASRERALAIQDATNPN